MKLRINYSKSFEKQLKKAPLEIKRAFRNRLELFIDNSFNPQLNNHILIGKFAGFRSINVTGDWRSLYIETIVKSEREVIFIFLGTHSQLYK